MSYEEEKQDRKIEQLEIKIEWLQNANTNFVRRICDQTREIERLRAKVGKMEFLMRSTEDTCLACAIKLEVIDQQAARIQELEEALAEYQRLGKTIAGKVPCLALHGDCGRCSAKMRGVCGALEQIAGGKIGPDADECPDDLPPIGSPYRSWQITEERKDAIRWAEEMAGDCKAGDVLRAMLEASQ